MQSLRALWTRESLHDLIREKLQDYRFIVVANREPFIHRYAGDLIECIQPASGMVTALGPIIETCGGVWIGHGSGDADRQTVDELDHVAVPPDDPKYTLRRLWLTKEQEEGYYYGLSNQGLWPLCHITFTRPQFHPGDWQTYREVNELFAQAIIEEAAGEPTFVFIQDYHFALLPRLLKQRSGNMIVAQFWHIPWPNHETFGTFPWKEELLDGLLGNDLLGFHIRYHCQNFLDTVDRVLEAKVDRERFEVTRNGKVTVVHPFPISIDFEAHCEQSASRAVERRMDRWRRDLGLRDEHLLGVGIERLDYTKGIPDRFRALDLLLEQHPEARERVVFVQVAVPSRSQIPAYKQTETEIETLTKQINQKWATETWKPIILITQHKSPAEMMALHRLANFCVVSSLHDGMNLVAKEFVASRIDEDGVLVLSEFTGAARELSDALLVNPFAVDALAAAMHTALIMPPDERHKRMLRMRAEVARNNVYRWAGKVLSALLKFDFPEEPMRRAAAALSPVAVGSA
jgi:trehalose 6-phosphate synthase